MVTALWQELCLSARGLTPRDHLCLEGESAATFTTTL